LFSQKRIFEQKYIPGYKNESEDKNNVFGKKGIINL
jgi:hypothetical protein